MHIQALFKKNANLQHILKNTAVLFLRQILLVLISLYTVRVLLQKLGITDYGILNAVLSVAMLLSFVTSSIGMITQRYLAFAMGADSHEDTKRYYNSCLTIAIIGGLLIFVLLESLGLWFVSRHMAIVPGRHGAVMLLYQLLVLQTAASTLMQLSTSVIIVREDMQIFALFSVLEALLRLCAAFSISYIPFDSLVAYGSLLVGSAFAIMCSQWTYCVLRYEECSPRWLRVDLVTLREMVSFVRWTLLGQITTVCRTQAITLLINQAFNPATVAARALSFTIQNQVHTFTQNFTQALNPPIIKAYASGNQAKTFSLIMMGSKLAFFLSWIITLPLIALLPGVLNVWLADTYPEETVLFTRLALVEGALLSISLPLMAAVRAVGDMRTYELMLGALQVLVLLMSWILVRQGFPAYWVFIVAIAINVVMFAVRLWLAQRLLGLNAMAYARAVLLPIVLVVAMSATVSMALIAAAPGSSILNLSLFSLAAVAGIVLSAPISVLTLGLSKAERSTLQGMILARFAKRKLSS